MALYGRIDHPNTLIKYLSGKDPARIDESNYYDYLSFCANKQKKSMAETLAMECYTLTYIANLIAKLTPDSTVIVADGKRRTLAQILSERPNKPAAVFMTSISANFPAAAATALILNYGRIPVIIGGIHVSTSPDDVTVYIRRHAPYPHLLSQVSGPAEISNIRQILTDLANQNLNNLYTGQKVLEDGLWGQPNVITMPQPKVDRLKKIPLIGKLMVRKFRVNVTTPYIGCPFSCRFCSISTLPKDQRRFSVRDPADFINELANFQKNGVHAHNRFYFFLPDNLLLGGKKLEEILDRLISSRLKINFAAQISIEVANNEKLLTKLRKAGATHFFIGLESLDIRNLEYIGKNVVHDIKREQLSVADYYKQQLKRIQDHGICVHGSFIFGLPFDYFNNMHDHTGVDVADFCIDTHIGLQPCALTDLPGSTNHRESQSSGDCLYGQQGTLDYLVGLCVSDLSEPNRIPFDSLQKSPLLVCYMTYQAIQRVGATSTALQNGLFATAKALRHPTHNGKRSLKNRLEDGLWAFAAQLAVGLYKDHGDLIVHTQNGVRGVFERLYRSEKNVAIKRMFGPWVDQFCGATQTDDSTPEEFECIMDTK